MLPYQHHKGIKFLKNTRPKIGCAKRFKCIVLRKNITMNFKELHEKDGPILIGNVWDVASAKVAQDLGFQAIGTSSGAIASMLGYQDGEEMSFEELVYVVERITTSTNVPLTVDLEAGYSRNPRQIADNIMRLMELGVLGVNIEDSIVNEKRELMDADKFAKILEEVCSILARQGQQVFVNVRTDTFLLSLPNATSLTIERAKKYKEAGGNGLFVPCIEKEKDIEAVVSEINLPLNVMSMPKLPAFSTLSQLGVKRISMGNFVYNKMHQMLEQELKAILQHQSFQSLFA